MIREAWPQTEAKHDLTVPEAFWWLGCSQKPWQEIKVGRHVGRIPWWWTWEVGSVEVGNSQILYGLNEEPMGFPNGCEAGYEKNRVGVTPRFWAWATGMIQSPLMGLDMIAGRTDMLQGGWILHLRCAFVMYTQKYQGKSQQCGQAISMKIEIEGNTEGIWDSGTRLKLSGYVKFSEPWDGHLSMATVTAGCVL